MELLLYVAIGLAALWLIARLVLDYYFPEDT